MCDGMFKKNDGKTVRDKDEDDRIGASSRPMVQQQKQDCHCQHKRQEKHNRGHQNIGVQSSQCVLNDRVQDVDLERVLVFWFLDFQGELIDNVRNDFIDPHFKCLIVVRCMYERGIRQEQPSTVRM